MKQFSEQEKEDIAQDYLINYNIQLLAKKYRVSSARIRTVLKNKNNFSVLHLDGNKQVIDILTKIYENSSDEIVLSRKFKRFNEFLTR